jgi:hypothetical protein
MAEESERRYEITIVGIGSASLFGNLEAEFGRADAIL